MMTEPYMIDSHGSKASVIGPVTGQPNLKPAYSAAQS
jgi:hypothetical protein